MADTYRGFELSHDAPPIPLRSFDWSAAPVDYDLGDPILTGPTREAVIAEVDRWWEEEAEDYPGIVERTSRAVASPSLGEGRPEALKDRLLASDWQGARAEARRRVDEAIEASRAGEPWPEYAPGAAIAVYRKQRLIGTGAVERYHDDTGEFHATADQFLTLRIDDSFDKRISPGTYAFTRTASGGYGGWLGRAKRWSGRDGIGLVKVMPAGRPGESGHGGGEE